MNRFDTKGFINRAAALIVCCSVTVVGNCGFATETAAKEASSMRMNAAEGLRPVLSTSGRGAVISLVVEPVYAYGKLSGVGKVYFDVQEDIDSWTVSENAQRVMKSGHAAYTSEMFWNIYALTNKNKRHFRMTALSQTKPENDDLYQLFEKLAVVCVYDKQQRFLGMDFIKLSENGLFSFAVPVEAGTADHIRCFLVDNMTSIVPLSQPFTFPVGGIEDGGQVN